MTDPDPRWLVEAQASIAEREYEASQTEAGLQAPNRAQDLRTYFEKTGIRVHYRTAQRTGVNAELLRLTLSGLGRGHKLATLPTGERVVAQGSRVEIPRSALGLVEWYENSERGLEQGFTLTKRPLADRGDARFSDANSPGREALDASALVLELAVSGAKASLRGDSVALATAPGRVLGYSGLKVVDALGSKLASHFEVPSEDRIRLVVEDREATYPIVIDPLLTSVADTQLESNQAFFRMGERAASAGDVNGDGYDDLIVTTGLVSFSTRVDVFHGGPNGIASGGPGTAATTLTCTQFLVDFGQSVASAGDVNGDGYDDVIVGSSSYDAGNGAQEGAAFIFLGSASGIASGTEVTAATRLESNQAGARLGLSVASAGDVNGDGFEDVLVGAPNYDNPTTDEGAAFVFFGSAVGIANGHPGNAGARLESNQASAAMGQSVSSAGDVNADGYADVLIGAPAYDAGTTDEGAVFLFFGSASGIANGTGNPITAKGVLDSNQAGAGFGIVAAAGDVNGDGYGDVIVGAPGYDFPGGPNVDEGYAFVFHGGASGIPPGSVASAATQIRSLDLGGGALSPRFSYSVGSGDVNGDGYADLIVGAPAFTSGESNEGATFVFPGGPTGITATSTNNAVRRLESNQQGAAAGTAAGSAGDVDGDGFDDVFVGAPEFSAGQSSEGALFAYRGGAFGITDFLISPPPAFFSSSQGGARLGWSLASAGDVNGDGFGDILIGASLYDDGQTDEGAAFVFHGSAIGFQLGGGPTTANAVLTSNQAFAQMGGSVASAGDVNGDGYGDVIVDASLYDNGETDEGAAFVFLGSPSGVASGSATTAHARLEMDQGESGGLGGIGGLRVASAGDVNGDGYGDVILGNRRYDNGTTDEGAAFIFHGGPAGIANGSPATAATILESNQGASTGLITTPAFGLSVAAAGDVNADGFGDVVVGAPGYETGLADAGAAFVFLGSAVGVASASPATAHARLESSLASALFGQKVASAGDVNADGFADLIVAAARYADPSTGPAAYLFHGSHSGLSSGSQSSAQTALTINSPPPPLSLLLHAVSVSPAGDVNTDGFADVAVSFHVLESTPSLVAGETVVYLGSATGVVPTRHATIATSSLSTILGTDMATTAGDVDGDGTGDLLVGGYISTTGVEHAFVRLSSGGRSLLLRQRRGDGSGIFVQPQGGSFASNSFVVDLVARSAVGRERGKIEIETCPIGRPFGAPACFRTISPNWVDLGTSGAAFAQAVSGLAPNTSYSWRARILTIPMSATQPGITPTPKASPWFRLAARATVGDIRTVPEPIASIGFAIGAMVLGWLRRQRRSASCSRGAMRASGRTS